MAHLNPLRLYLETETGRNQTAPTEEGGSEAETKT